MNKGMWVVIGAILAILLVAPVAAADSTVLPADVRLVQASPADAQVVYAVAGKQVFRSDNKGLSWTQVGQTPSHITALALARQDTERLYAGTETSGLWRSLDGGLTWHESNAGLGAGPGAVTQVTTITVDPEDDAILYAATALWLGSWQARLMPLEIAFSLDGGSNWLPLAQAGLQDYPVRKLIPVDGLPFTVLAFDERGDSTMHRADKLALLGVATEKHESPERRNAASEALNMLTQPVPAPTSYPAWFGMRFWPAFSS
jgi:hypothetical protein